MATGFGAFEAMPQQKPPAAEEGDSKEIIETAQEQGLVTAEEVEGLSEEEVQHLASYEQARREAAQRRKELGEHLITKYLSPESGYRQKNPASEASRTFFGKHLPGFAREVAEGDEGGFADFKLTRSIPELGIIVTEKGGVRLKSPDAEGAPGVYANGEVMKAFLTGWKEAQRPDERKEVINDIYTYLGLEIPENLDEKAFEGNSGEGLVSWVKSHVREAAALAAVFMVAASGLDLNARSTGNTAKAEGGATSEPSQRETMEEVYALKPGEGLITVANKLLKACGYDTPTGNQIYQVTARLADASKVGIPEYGIKGTFHHKKLPVGFQVDTRSAQQLIESFGEKK